MSIKSDMFDLINESVNKGTSAYESQAKVVRVDGDTLWVHIAGGVDETPVKRTINARVGDTVQVRVSGGRAYVQGNATNPPTDDRTANIAKSVATKAQTTAQEAEKMAESAENTAKGASATASQAKQIADNTEQHFWFNETGEDTGAHITEVTQDEWNDTESPNYHKGGNLLARTNGIAIRDGLTEKASLGIEGIRIGENDGSRTIISQDLFSIITKNGVEALEINSSESATSTQKIVVNYDNNDWVDITNRSYIFAAIDSMPENHEFSINILRTSPSGGGSSWNYNFVKGTAATVTTTLYGQYEFPVTYDGTNVISTSLDSNLAAEIVGYSFYSIEYVPQVTVNGEFYVDDTIWTFGHSRTSGNTAAKVFAPYSEWSGPLIKNMVLKARFENANTASNVTLNYNNTGDIPAYYNGQRISGSIGSWGDTTAYYDGHGYIVYFYYDGSVWQEFSESTPLDIALKINLLKLGWYQVYSN